MFDSGHLPLFQHRVAVHLQQPHQRLQQPERRDRPQAQVGLAAAVQADRREREKHVAAAEEFVDLPLDLPAGPDRLAEPGRSRERACITPSVERLAAGIDAGQLLVEPGDGVVAAGQA